MKVKVPEKEIEVCDCCGRTGYLKECLVCGGSYCLMCEGLICGCVVSVDICKKCKDRQDVRAIIDKNARPLMRIKNKRDNELLALRK